MNLSPNSPNAKALLVLSYPNNHFIIFNLGATLTNPLALSNERFDILLNWLIHHHHIAVCLHSAQLHLFVQTASVHWDSQLVIRTLLGLIAPDNAHNWLHVDLLITTSHKPATPSFAVLHLSRGTGWSRWSTNQIPLDYTRGILSQPQVLIVVNDAALCRSANCGQN